MTEERVFELMELAIEALQEKLPQNMYIDDIAWGVDCFRLPIWCDNRMDSYIVRTFSFYYDEDDTRTDKQQVLDEMQDFIDMYF